MHEGENETQESTFFMKYYRIFPGIGMVYYFLGPNAYY